MASEIIDIHVHPPTEGWLYGSGGSQQQHAADYFGVDLDEIVEPLDETVEKFESCGIDRAVLFAWDAETNTGNPRVTNEWVAEACDDYDMFLGFASVDPHKGEIARQEAREAIEDLDLDGFKFQQAAQGFFPNDRRFDPLWETLEELGKPALFHGGTTGLGAGAPGGDGVHLKYTKPIPYLDDVATRYPELPIIIAHPAWPWYGEQLAMAMHKRNVYIDLSGWRPKYIPDEVMTYVKTRLADKTLFGTDYPFIEPDDWLSDFEEMDFPDDVREKVLHENARKLLDL